MGAQATAQTMYRQGDVEAGCAICLCSFSDVAAETRVVWLSRCRHGFCAPCIDNWWEMANSCPTCRQVYASTRHCLRISAAQLLEYAASGIGVAPDAFRCSRQRAAVLPGTAMMANGVAQVDGFHRPHLHRKFWTAAEEELLKDTVQRSGDEAWVDISAGWYTLTGAQRTAVALQNKWQRLMSKQKPVAAAPAQAAAVKPTLQEGRPAQLPQVASTDGTNLAFQGLHGSLAVGGSVPTHALQAFTRKGTFPSRYAVLCAHDRCTCMEQHCSAVPQPPCVGSGLVLVDLQVVGSVTQHCRVACRRCHQWHANPLRHPGAKDDHTRGGSVRAFTWRSTVCTQNNATDQAVRVG